MNGVSPKPWRAGVGAVAAAALLPVVRILANNPDENLSLVRLAIWGVGFLALGLILFWVARRFDPSGTRRLEATVIVALLTLLMYGSTLANALELREPQLKLSMAAALIVAGWLVARWSGVQRFLLILPFFLLVAPAVDLVTSARARTPSVDAVGSVNLPPPSAERQRNVYWFILDGYGRWDVLQALGGTFDLGGRLEELGFEVDERAVAPYEYTDFSIGATVAATYLPEIDDFDEMREVAKPVLNGAPPVFAWFSEAGYRRLQLPGARWPGWSCGPPDSTCLLGSPVHLEDDLVYSITVLDAVLDLLTMGVNDRLARGVDPVPAIENAFSIQSDDPVGSRDYLSVIHVMSSHPPYRWLGPDCEPQPASILMANWLPVTDYLDAVRCTGLRVLEAVDRILEEDPDSIVVIQGDHGPRLRPETWQAVDSDITIDTAWLGVLMAARLPDGCELGEGNNTVNLFRIVIGCLSGQEVERLPSHSWYQDLESLRIVPAAPDHGSD